jgi:hypothetical protein
MKKTLAALAAAGFVAMMAGPAWAGGGCGSWGTQSVGTDGDHRTVAEGEQSIPTTTKTETQTASTEAATE